MRTIPKIIHYCWFGGKEKPKDVEIYIKTWEKNMPDYSLMEWSEQNFSINNAPLYVQEAYKAGKFAFVSDYARIMALYKFGGIYFDTDIEVLQSFEDYLEGHSMVLGFESERLLMTAFIASEKEHPFLKEFEETYQNRHFIHQDGSYDLSTINDHFSSQAECWGVDLGCNEEQILKGNIRIYPSEVFCGFDVKKWHVRTTAKTCTVHHMASSWVTSKKKLYFGIIIALQKLLGFERYDQLKNFYDRLKSRIWRKIDC